MNRATAVYQARLRAVRLSTAQIVGTAFAQWPSRDLATSAQFAASIAPVVASGQLTAARTTSAYVARRARITPVRITPQLVTGSAARRGVDPLDEYQRPFGIYAGAMADEELEPVDAEQRARRRLDVLVLADIWLASRAAMTLLQNASERIGGWIRVADASACDLCADADGATASAAEDIAFHPGCGCTAEPTEREPEAPDSEIHVDDHGELGAVLVDPPSAETAN